MTRRAYTQNTSDCQVETMGPLVGVKCDALVMSMGHMVSDAGLVRSRMATWMAGPLLQQDLPASHDRRIITELRSR